VMVAARRRPLVAIPRHVKGVYITGANASTQSLRFGNRPTDRRRRFSSGSHCPDGWRNPWPSAPGPDPAKRVIGPAHLCGRHWSGPALPSRFQSVTRSGGVVNARNATARRRSTPPSRKHPARNPPCGRSQVNSAPAIGPGWWREGLTGCSLSDRPV
jgi:hypothetical protein